jgi:hypothetical protein
MEVEKYTTLSTLELYLKLIVTLRFEENILKGWQMDPEEDNTRIRQNQFKYRKYISNISGRTIFKVWYSTVLEYNGHKPRNNLRLSIRKHIQPVCFCNSIFSRPGSRVGRFTRLSTTWAIYWPNKALLNSVVAKDLKYKYFKFFSRKELSRFTYENITANKQYSVWRDGEHSCSHALRNTSKLY